MNRHGPERCKFCGAPATVRMQGLTLCARCGLERSSGRRGTVRRGHRAVLLGLLSSGFLAKMVVGAVALAAVGGVAVAIPRDPRPLDRDNNDHPNPGRGRDLDTHIERGHIG